MSHCTFVRLLGLAAFACVATFAAAPPLDLAPFGQYTVWRDDGSAHRLKTLADVTTNAGHLGLEWREERDIERVRVRFAGAAPSDVRIEYWFHTWPAERPHMPTTEDQADDAWQGKWLPATTKSACAGDTCDVTFAPLAKSENPNAENLPGVPYRRMLKIRLARGATHPAVTSFSAYSDAYERTLSVRIALGR